VRTLLLLALVGAAVPGDAPAGTGSLLVVLVLLVGSAFFSGSETAVVSASRARLERLAEGERRDARAALGLLRDTPRTIAATLVGTNVCNIGAASLATAFAVGVSPEHGPALATLVLTPIVLFGGEILPKALFRTHATSLLLASAGALQAFTWLFRPVMALTSATTRALLFVLRIPPSDRGPVFRREDLENLFLYGVADAERRDTPPETGATLRMAGRVLELVKRSVSEAMVPLPPEVTIPAAGTVGDAVACFRRTRRGILAALDDRGEVAGFVSARDILGEPPDRAVAPYLRPTYHLGPDDSLDGAIGGFRRRRHSVGLVRDAEGRTLGMLTPEDVLEEVVGELRHSEPPGTGGESLNR